MHAIVAALILTIGACATPSSRPLPQVARTSAMDASGTTETRAECRQMRDRAFLTAALGSGAAAVATGIGGLALPFNDRGLQLGFGIASVLTAAAGATLALLSTSYQGTLDTHCNPWPRP